MSSALKFSQKPAVGETVVVDTGLLRPYLTMITGHGTKGDEPILFHAGDGWCRPEDVTVIPRRMAILMAVVADELRARDAASYEEHKGAIYLAALETYADGGDQEADLAKLREAAVAAAARLGTEAPAPRM